MSQTTNKDSQLRFKTVFLSFSDARKLFRLLKGINELKNIENLLKSPPADADLLDLSLSELMSDSIPIGLLLLLVLRQPGHSIQSQTAQTKCDDDDHLSYALLVRVSPADCHHSTQKVATTENKVQSHSIHPASES